MNKILFSDNTEMQIEKVTQSGDVLNISINTSDATSVIAKFRDKSATSVMRYYSGIDLIRGYAGFTMLQRVSFAPNVIINIDYETEDKETESGFLEQTADQCTVTMKKKPLIVSVAGQTAQNTANIDYLAMETGIVL